MEQGFSEFYGVLTNPHPLIPIGMLLLGSFAGGRLVGLVGLPRVTGYVLVGIAAGPSALGLLTKPMVQIDLSIITDIALGFIAFSIGGTLLLGQLRRLGGPIVWIAFAQALTAFAVTTLALTVALPLLAPHLVPHDSAWRAVFPLALITGALSAATAPAATLAVVHETGAKGPFTTVLLGVVALDDAVTLFLYAIAVGVGRALLGQGVVSWHHAVGGPTREIVTAVAVGAGIGLGLRYGVRLATRRETLLAVALGCVLLTSGVAIGLQVSPLLANMTLGFVAVNFTRHPQHLFEVLDPLEESLLGMFFALAGAHVDLGLLTAAGFVALVIVASRFCGKLLGSNLGARISNAPTSVRRYLGFALLPKAGVTIGLALVVREVVGDTPLTEVMVSAVLVSVLLNELLAPVLASYALRRAGETHGA